MDSQKILLREIAETTKLSFEFIHKLIIPPPCHQHIPRRSSRPARRYGRTLLLLGRSLRKALVDARGKTSFLVDYF